MFALVFKNNIPDFLYFVRFCIKKILWVSIQAFKVYFGEYRTGKLMETANEERILSFTKLLLIFHFQICKKKKKKRWSQWEEPTPCWGSGEVISELSLQFVTSQRPCFQTSLFCYVFSEKWSTQYGVKEGVVFSSCFQGVHWGARETHYY